MSVKDEEKEKNGLENQNQNQDDQNQDQNNDQQDDFDPNKFLDFEENNNSDDNQDSNNNNQNQDDDQNDDDNQNQDDDNDDIWDFNFEDDNDDQNDDNQNQDDNQDQNQDDNQNNDQNDNNQNQDDNNGQDNNDQFVSQFNQLGFNAKNSEEALQQIKDLVEQNQNYQTASYSDKNIENWKKYLSLKDKELVLANFKAEGATDEKAQEMAETLESNGMLSVRAHEIRGSLNSAIKKRVNDIKSAEQAQTAKQTELVEKTRKELVNHLEKIDTMYGLKMAKDENLSKVRGQLFDFIVSGKMNNKIFASPESVSEVAWFILNKEKIISGFKNQGSNKGKMEILEDIQNPTKTPDAIQHNNDGSDGEFNVGKFMSGV